MILPPEDEGRYAVTNVEGDRYAFKSPTLRNTPLTPPCFHSGVVWELETAVDHGDDAAAATWLAALVLDAARPGEGSAPVTAPSAATVATPSSLLDQVPSMVAPTAMLLSPSAMATLEVAPALTVAFNLAHHARVRRHGLATACALLEHGIGGNDHAPRRGSSTAERERTVTRTMQAVVLTRYGEQGVLELREVPIPSPKPDEVLVRVHATTINDADWGAMRGKPVLIRLFMGLRAPKVEILGTEVAGRVEEVGAAATAFRPGDAVYGDLSAVGFGGFAEYVCVPERALTAKPERMTYEQAASVPHAFALAWQGLVDEGGLSEGQRILINGAGGGVGTFGVQIAASLGAEVTGVDSAPKLPAMQELGFAHVIDYEQKDFTRSSERYDLVLDTKTNRAPRTYRRVLEPGGTYVTIGGELPRLAQVFLAGRVSARHGGARMRVLALRPNQGNAQANRMFDAGQLRFALDGPYSLADLPDAMQHFGAARHVGKVVIRVATDET